MMGQRSVGAAGGKKRAEGKGQPVKPPSLVEESDLEEDEEDEEELLEDDHHSIKSPAVNQVSKGWQPY